VSNANATPAVGAAALSNNTDGDANTATGVDALLSNTTGSSNTAVDNETLTSNTSGNLNVAIGHHALMSNTMTATIRQSAAIPSSTTRAVVAATRLSVTRRYLPALLAL
jgi:trimeric autotransporter adhesin